MLRPPFSQEPIPIDNWDVIVIGAGAAGLMTCLELPSNLKVLLLNRNTSKVSSSRWAQGGIASVVRQDDSFDLHAEDTLKAGDGLCDFQAVEMLVKEAPGCVERLQNLGMIFDQSSDQLATTLEAAHSRRRVLHVKDRTGRALVEVLEDQLSRDQQSLNEKKIEHEINKISLKEILNLKGDFETNKEQNLIGFWNHKLNKNINQGLDKNLSLKNLTLQKSIKKSQAKSFLAQNKPNIYISNSLSSTFSKGDSLATNIDSAKSGSNYTNTISLNFAWSIFDGGQNKNSYKSKIADAESEKYAYENLKNILTTSISKAYLNLKLNEEKIISSLKEIESSKESVRLSRLRYDVGISTLKDVLVRQSELSNAKSKNINAIYNYNLNINELERLTFLDKSKNCLVSENNKIKDKESICNLQR